MDKDQVKYYETIDKIGKVAKSTNVKKAIADLEQFKEHGFKKRQQNGRAIRRGQEMREVARIPLSLYHMLPESVKNDQNELAKWLETKGKEFMIVERL